MSAGVICLLPLSSTGTTQSSWDRVSEAPASAASHLVNYHRKTINLEDKCQSVVWGGGFLLFLLKHKQWRSNQLWINPKLCNEGNAVWTNSVITARPEMNAGRVKSLWSVLGLRGLFGGKKKKKSSGWWPPAITVWQRISLSPLQSKAPFLSTVISDVLEKWHRHCCLWKRLLVLLVRTGKGFRLTHSPKTRSHHMMTHRLTVAILHFNRGSRQDTVRLSQKGESVCAFVARCWSFSFFLFSSCWKESTKMIRMY